MAFKQDEVEKLLANTGRGVLSLQRASQGAGSSHHPLASMTQRPNYTPRPTVLRARPGGSYARLRHPADLDDATGPPGQNRRNV